MGKKESALRDEVSRVMTRIFGHDDDSEVWYTQEELIYKVDETGSSKPIRPL